MKKIFTVRGTHCQACKALIEDVCSEIPGIVTCKVDFKTGRTEVEYLEEPKWEKVKQEIASLGDYQVLEEKYENRQ